MNEHIGGKEVGVNAAQLAIQIANQLQIKKCNKKYRGRQRRLRNNLLVIVKVNYSFVVLIGHGFQIIQHFQ